jgi:Helix-turn-helix domain
MEGAMSIGALLHVLQHSKTTKSQRLILLHLADHATDSGLAWPSHRLLATETGYTRQWVIQAIDDLVRGGSLKVVYNAKGNVRYQLPVYDTKTKTCSCEGELSTGQRQDCQVSLQAPPGNCKVSLAGVNSPACNPSHPNRISSEPYKDEPVKMVARFGLSTEEADEFDRRYAALYGR